MVTRTSTFRVFRSIRYVTIKTPLRRICWVYHAISDASPYHRQPVVSVVLEYLGSNAGKLGQLLDGTRLGHITYHICNCLRPQLSCFVRLSTLTAYRHALVVLHCSYQHSCSHVALKSYHMSSQVGPRKRFPDLLKSPTSSSSMMPPAAYQVPYPVNSVECS